MLVQESALGKYYQRQKCLLKSGWDLYLREQFISKVLSTHSLNWSLLPWTAVCKTELTSTIAKEKYNGSGEAFCPSGGLATRDCQCLGDQKGGNQKARREAERIPLKWEWFKGHHQRLFLGKMKGRNLWLSRYGDEIHEPPIKKWQEINRSW